MVRLCVEGERLPSRMHNEQLPSYETKLWCGFCIGQGCRTAYRHFASIGSLKTHIHQFRPAALDQGRPACPYPLCIEVLDGIENFKNHFATVYGVNLQRLRDRRRKLCQSPSLVVGADGAVLLFLCSGKSAHLSVLCRFVLVSGISLQLVSFMVDFNCLFVMVSRPCPGSCLITRPARYSPPAYDRDREARRIPGGAQHPRSRGAR